MSHLEVHVRCPHVPALEAQEEELLRFLLQASHCFHVPGARRPPPLPIHHHRCLVREVPQA